MRGDGAETLGIEFVHRVLRGAEQSGYGIEHDAAEDEGIHIDSAGGVFRILGRFQSFFQTRPPVPDVNRFAAIAHAKERFVVAVSVQSHRSQGQLHGDAIGVHIAPVLHKTVLGRIFPFQPYGHELTVVDGSEIDDLHRIAPGRQRPQNQIDRLNLVPYWTVGIGIQFKRHIFRINIRFKLGLLEFLGKPGSDEMDQCPSILVWQMRVGLHGRAVQPGGNRAVNGFRLVARLKMIGIGDVVNKDRVPPGIDQRVCQTPIAFAGIAVAIVAFVLKE